MQRAARSDELGDLRSRLRRTPGHVAVVVPGGDDPAAVERELASRGIPVMRLGEDKALPESRVTVDMARRLAMVDGREIALPPKEFEILAELVARAGRPVPAGEIARRVWPAEDHATVADVHRHIYRLKRALGEEELIANRRGYGYVLIA